MARDDSWLQIVAGIAALVIWLIQAIYKAAKRQQPGPEPATLPAPPPPPLRPLRAEDLRAIGARARELGERLAHDRANHRFMSVLREWVPARTEALVVADPLRQRQGAAALDLVIEEIEEHVAQRRDPVLAAALGDADRLAESCYAPLLAFARAKELPLASVHPVTRLSHFPLSIWSAFLPTSIAPIFLPPDFFQHIVWWPGLAHEIAHDFLGSTAGLDGALRRDLHLPAEATGARLLDANDDAGRLFGAWLEEMFCDVFGTLMLGPAYVVTLQRILPTDPTEAFTVPLDGVRYDVHPPPHLRVVVATAALRFAGLTQEAHRLKEQWFARLGMGPRPLTLFVPARMQLWAVPAEPFEEAMERIAERLVHGPLPSLAGFGLRQIPGLDYGPAEDAAARRAQATLLAGGVPRVRSARAIVSGAVLAWAERPEDERKIVALVRAAIPAVGTLERRPDVYAPAKVESPVAEESPWRDAIVLREILQRRGPRRMI